MRSVNCFIQDLSSLSISLGHPLIRISPIVVKAAGIKCFIESNYAALSQLGLSSLEVSDELLRYARQRRNRSHVQGR